MAEPRESDDPREPVNTVDTVDLRQLGEAVVRGDAGAAGRARAAGDPADGRLTDLAEWLAETRGTWPPTPLGRTRCLVLGPAADRVQATATELGVGLRSLDLPATVPDAVALGVTTADAEVDSGTELVVLAGASPGSAAAGLVGALTSAEPVALLPRGALAVDTAAWIALAEQLRDTRRRLAPVAGRPAELLAALGHPGLACATALVLRLAARRTPTVLDGTVALSAALLATRVQPRVARWLMVADTSPDPVHRRAREAIGRATVWDLGTSRGDGLAGLLALPVLRAATHAPNADPKEPADE